jgi:hypothetical protein
MSTSLENQKERERENVVVLLEEEIGKKAGSFCCRRCSKADLLF